jgi:hypothetical protein
MSADTLMLCLPLHTLLAGTVSAAFTLTEGLPKMMFGCASDGPQRLSAVFGQSGCGLEALALLHLSFHLENEFLSGAYMMVPLPSVPERITPPSLAKLYASTLAAVAASRAAEKQCLEVDVKLWNDRNDGADGSQEDSQEDDPEPTLEPHLTMEEYGQARARITGGGETPAVAATARAHDDGLSALDD